MNITIKLLKIVMLMTYVRKKGMARGIVLVVIGSIIIVFFGVYGYIVYLQAPGWVSMVFLPIIVGVVIVVIGLCLLLDYYRVFRSDEPGKKSRWKQAEPIT